MHTLDTRGSKASHCLERAWAALQTILPGLPSVVCVILSADSPRRKLGHFAAHHWRNTTPRQTHELAITPSLFENPENLLATLLHEAAHALLDESAHGGVGYCRHYHNKIFAKQCRELGLECLFMDTRYGFSHTQWPCRRDIPSCYAPVLTILKEGLPLGTAPRQLPRRASRPLPPSGYTRLVCACPNRLRRSVYVKASVLQQGQIRCELCATLFRPSIQPVSITPTHTVYVESRQEQ